MPGFTYHRMGVFTSQPFGGNQLAVFPDAAGIPPQHYQAIAREFNLPETTFVLPAQTEGTHFWLRIFTPATELPMAGHPTIGSAYVLAKLGLFDPSNGPLVFEEGVGKVPVDISGTPEAPGLITMSQPQPAFGEQAPGPSAAAAMVGLETADLHPGLPVQWVSCGVPYLIIPLKNLDAVRRSTPRLDIWDHSLADCEARAVMVFTPDAETPEGNYHARMFAPPFGVIEDPATGSAAGPLGCYLVHHGVHQADAPMVVEQGFEMQRPSFLHITIGQAGNTIRSVKVGGQSVYMGQGVLEI